MDRAEDPATLFAATVSAAADLGLLSALPPDLERVLGAGHLTLAARGRDAELRGDEGDFEAARDLFAALVPDLRRVLGAEHPDTLAARVRLADWTGMAGLSPATFGARRAFRQFILRVVRTFRRGRCPCRGCAGRAAARDQLARLVPDLLRVMGADHPDTLRARWSLALWTAEAGDAAAGRDQYAALLPDLDRVLGADHALTHSARLNLDYSTRLAEEQPPIINGF